MAKRGYSKIDNDLFKIYLPCQNLTGSEMRVLIFIIWNTLCFKRKYHNMAHDYISAGTDLSERQVKRVISSLCEKGYITIKCKGKGTHPQTIEISSDIFGYLWGHNRLNRGDIVGKKNTENVTQEIKEEIKDKEIKNKKKAAPNSFPSVHINNYTPEEAREWQEVLSQEDWKDFINGKVW